MSRVWQMSEGVLFRQITLLELIPRHSRPLSVTELLERLASRGFEVNRRTVQRDLILLSGKWPLVSDEARPPRWSWHPDAERFDLPGMDATTALAFAQAESHLRKLLPTAIAQELQPWFARARRVLDGGPLGGWAQRVRMIDEGQPLQTPVIEAAVFEAVTTALLEERALRLRYASRSKSRTDEHIVHPLALVWRGPLAYLVVVFDDYQDPRSLALQRIQTAYVLDEPARRLPGFDLDAWLAQRDFDLPLGDDIELHAVLSREMEVLLRERPLAPDQQLEAAGDHEFVLRVRVADTMRLRWWLLGFGDRITVLGPDRLREEMAATVRRMAAAYAGGAARDSMVISSTPATDMAVSAAMNVQTAAHQ